MMNLKKSIILFGLFLCITFVKAQTVPVGLLDNTDDYFRRQQLLGNDTSSFMIRPLHHISGSDLNSLLWSNQRENIAFYALPVVWQQQYNTDHPYGINDGAMIPAKGYQNMFSAGFAAKIGPLSIQLRPEVIYAENKAFRKILEAKNRISIKNFYRATLNNIDLPERFGDESYTKLNWGQSSIRLNAGPVSFGISNENLWWGPGTRNSLLMTNNAAGFKHLTLNTLRPIKTPIGSFEAQIVGGKLEASGIIPTFTTYKPKPNDWRYFSGIVFSYQPKWLSGLYLGFDRTFILNRKEMGKGFTDYFPIFIGLTKNNFSVEGKGMDEEDLKARDQRISLFARWVMPDNKAEVYFQYGREDHSKDLRDLVSEPEHSRAYVVGIRKLIALNQPDAFIQLGFEVTKLDEPATTAVRSPPTWYTHTHVRDGYTQQGQILGAGIGPGSDLLSIDANWVSGWNRIGLQFERLVNNNTLYDKDLALNRLDRNPWIDWGITAKYDKEYKRFIFNSQLAYVKSTNYQWALPDSGEDSANNFQIRVGVLYRW